MIFSKRTRSFSSGKAIMILLLCIGFVSCNSFKEENSIVTNGVEVVDTNKDTVFSITNRQLKDAVNITIEGELSDTCVVAVSTDSTFLSKATYYVSTPKIAFSQKMNLTDIKGDSLYIKYHPIRNPNSGDLKIGITFL